MGSVVGHVMDNANHLDFALALCKDLAKIWSCLIVGLIFQQRGDMIPLL